jgi:hypothetical protein
MGLYHSAASTVEEVLRTLRRLVGDENMDWERLTLSGKHIASGYLGLDDRPFVNDSGIVPMRLVGPPAIMAQEAMVDHFTQSGWQRDGLYAGFFVLKFDGLPKIKKLVNPIVGGSYDIALDSLNKYRESKDGQNMLRANSTRWRPVPGGLYSQPLYLALTSKSVPDACVAKFIYEEIGGPTVVAVCPMDGSDKWRIYDPDTCVWKIEEEETISGRFEAIVLKEAQRYIAYLRECRKKEGGNLFHDGECSKNLHILEANATALNSVKLWKCMREEVRRLAVQPKWDQIGSNSILLVDKVMRFSVDRSVSFFPYEREMFVRAESRPNTKAPVGRLCEHHPYGYIDTVGACSSCDCDGVMSLDDPDIKDLLYIFHNAQPVEPVRDIVLGRVVKALAGTGLTGFTYWIGVPGACKSTIMEIVQKTVGERLVQQISSRLVLEGKHGNYQATHDSDQLNTVPEGARIAYTDDVPAQQGARFKESLKSRTDGPGYVVGRGAHARQPEKKPITSQLFVLGNDHIGGSEAIMDRLVLHPFENQVYTRNSSGYGSVRSGDPTEKKKLLERIQSGESRAGTYFVALMQYLYQLPDNESPPHELQIARQNYIGEAEVSSGAVQRFYENVIRKSESFPLELFRGLTQRYPCLDRYDGKSVNDDIISLAGLSADPGGVFFKALCSFATFKSTKVPDPRKRDAKRPRAGAKDQPWVPRFYAAQAYTFLLILKREKCPLPSNVLHMIFSRMQMNQ